MLLRDIVLIGFILTLTAGVSLQASTPSPMAQAVWEQAAHGDD
ncbi:hypothetical protein ACFSM5_02500 [Lacibacterium aquatile]|uniref:Uncharacterized protein n=1 Tax=Lacibacterium aquatile TaxID=1168082 RepID=A0ABW5DQC6_9PROT